MSDSPITKENLDRYLREWDREIKDIPIEYQEEKPGVVNSDNADSIIAALRKKKAEH